MKIEVLATTSETELHAWAADRAARDGITVAELIVRALAHERSRLKEGPRVDPRTVRLGARGASSKLTPGSIHSHDLAERLGCGPDLLVEVAKEGVARSDEPPARGRPTSFVPEEAYVAAIMVEVAPFNLPRPVRHTMADLARKQWPTARGRVLVVPSSGVIFVCGEDHLGTQLRTQETGTALCVSLEKAARRVTALQGLPSAHG